MNKLLFKIFSISLVAVDVISIALFVILYFLNSITISTLLKFQFALIIIVVVLNLLYVLYLATTLILNLIKQKKKQ